MPPGLSQRVAFSLSHLVAVYSPLGLPSVQEQGLLQGSKYITDKKAAFEGRVGWGKESQQQVHTPLDGQKNLGNWKRPRFSPLPGTVPESDNSGCLILWPLTHLSSSPKYGSRHFFFVRQDFSVAFGACPGTHSEDQAGLNLTEIQLPLPPECWN